ncbi:uncharacterized protein MYCGRDRAFT_71278 [Zymoseptoria tritici IPO323]|nr:uncharacterized protein MYCGRDRAFT_71278 [Zymoseptoria tritici IPO323]EGP88342.1 hypothetical protein MYCGRDRAFT_71278 [Zymoseptoria tritici IPO323]
MNPAITKDVRLRRLEAAHVHVKVDPYNLPLYVCIAQEYLGLGYPDLAAGACYKAILLSDALDDEADEYHEAASDSLKLVIQQQPLEERIRIIKEAMNAEDGETATPDSDTALDIELTLWLREHYRLIMYRILTRSLLLCECYRSAHIYLCQGIQMFLDDDELADIFGDLFLKIRNMPGMPENHHERPWEFSDNGWVRREHYPWNIYEPDRLNRLDNLNEMMEDVSDKLEVRAVALPVLNGDPREVVTQLGVFAKEDIEPGEVILNETSMLTANNRLQDALCDACSGDIPPLDSPDAAKVVVCSDCEVVFCSQWCWEAAVDTYHDALCGKDVEAIAKDVPPAEAADSLYALLLLRALAMSETVEWHPLDLPEVRFIWGDLSPEASDKLPYKDFLSPDSCLVPRRLPFSFQYNIRLPFHMLEKMDIDIFANPQYDVWVFNTLYAKFRGTASARLSGTGGTAIRGPEVSAVHPMWCLANHSCDPNVRWEWGGSIKFWSTDERVPWTGRDGKKVVKSRAGIKKGEEVLNHYCDIELSVKDRREWASGALGGDCMCDRCVWEAAEEEQANGKAK